jgi:hypothetical protein
LCLAQREGDAVVRREDDKGVIVQMTSLQLRQDEPHTLVHSNKRQCSQNRAEVANIKITKVYSIAVMEVFVFIYLFAA